MLHMLPSLAYDYVAARLGIASFVGSIITIWTSSEIISSLLAAVVAAGFCA